MKRRYYFLAAGFVLLLIFHRPLLRALGNYLIVEDAKTKVDGLFVLSGNAFDRGEEAARLYHEGWAPKLICLGGETNPALELYGIYDKTAVMSEGVLKDAGVPPQDIELLPKGTSTFEEFEAIRDFCKERSWTKVMVVSSKFHTRRIDRFFRLRLHMEGIEIVLRGAPESDFRESEWWKSEPGLIFLNNEYIKNMYYWLRY